MRERTCRTVRAEERKAHHLTSALLDSLRTRIVVEARLGGPGAAALTLMPVDSSSIAVASVIFCFNVWPTLKAQARGEVRLPDPAEQTRRLHFTREFLPFPDYVPH